jgi:hypothetical protein
MRTTVKISLLIALLLALSFVGDRRETVLLTTVYCDINTPSSACSAGVDICDGCAESFLFVPMRRGR